MAKIFGFQLKKVSYFEGREGTGCSADIYYHNKKVGHFLDEANGGEYDIRLDDYAFNSVMKDTIKRYFIAHPLYLTVDKTKEERYAKMFQGEDAFFDEILKLAEYEKIYKRDVKKGASITVFTKYPLFDDGPTPVAVYKSFACDENHPAVKSFMKTKQDACSTVKFDIFKSVDDFIIEE